MVIPLHGKVKTREMYKEELLELWQSLMQETGLAVNTGEKVESIEGSAGNFTLRTNRGEHVARRILLATGRRGTPRKLDVPGEKSSKVAYRLIEPEQYARSRVLVTGGGDSAVEAALAIAHEEGTEVAITYRGDVFARIKERNRQLLDKCAADGRIRVLLRSTVQEIRQKEVVLDVAGSALSLPNDYVLIMIGGTLPSEFLQKVGIEVRTRFGEA
jgi:thioredoxin reductase